LVAVSDPLVVEAFRAQSLGRVVVRGQGVTQSPAKFEADLGDLLRGHLPELHP
jgi:hypothetical protein